MSITLAHARDLPYIVDLSKKHAEELGFLPRAAMDAYLARGHVTLAKENGDPCGYFLVGAPNLEQRIFQACVQLDARGYRHGLALLATMVASAATAGTRIITLHCRDGLASNGFWAACGFHLARTCLGGAARRKIVNEWHLPIAAAISDPSLPYARSFLASIRTGTQPGTVPPPCTGVAGAPQSSRWTETVHAAAIAAATVDASSSSSRA